MGSLKERLAKSYKEDGALSWCVCLCAFLSNAIVYGIEFSFGELFGTIMKDLNSSEANVAWIASTHSSVQYLSASLSSILAKKFGFAPTITIGVFISTTFLALSATSNNVSVFTLHFGFFAGFGFGLIYTPGNIICSYYFLKRRALATGIAVCGGGIGTIVIPEVINFFKESYGWKGCAIIYAAMCPLNALLAMTVYILPNEYKETTVELNVDRHLDKHADRSR